MMTTQTRHKGKKNYQQWQGGAESSDYNVETRAQKVQCQLILQCFKVFAWQCEPGSSLVRVSVWRALILIFKP